MMLGKAIKMHVSYKQNGWPNKPGFRYLPVLVVVLFASICAGQEPPAVPRVDGAIQQQLDEAASRIAGVPTYDLQYRVVPGEEYRWSVEHTANSRVAQQKQTTDTSMRSTATKTWKILRVDSVGNITLTHSVDSMRLWQRVGEQDPVSYDSQTDSEVPAIFRQVAEMRGKPLATITVTPQGQETFRDSEHLMPQLGYGHATIPLPEGSIAIGQRWHTPQQWRVRNEDGISRMIHGRTSYELRKVLDGQAYITFQTEVLTPLENDHMRAQLMHYLSRGYVVFDLKRGLISMREVEWDCKVQGHVSPDSFMHHTAKLTEKLLIEIKPAVATPRSGADANTPVTDR